MPRDDEAYELWRKSVPAERIGELGADDNFWQMGDTGPCGRCSEIYFVKERTVPMMEIWNNVFMEFERSADGTLMPLPAPSIDTGMGLERITAVLQGETVNYDTDLFHAAAAGRRRAMCGQPYTGDDAADTSMRVVADHMRAMHVPDRRRRDPAQRVARLRAAQDHAARDAPRQAARASREPFMHELADASSPRWATPIRS